MPLPLIPLLPFTVAFITGILLQGCGMGGFFMFLLTAGAFAAAVLHRYSISILLIAMALGCLDSELHAPPQLPTEFSQHSYCFSGVTTEVRRFEPTQTLIVKIDSCNGHAIRPFRVKVSVPSSVPTVDERWRIHFPAKLDNIEYDPDLPDEIDYNSSLRRSGVIGQALVSPDSLRIIQPEPGLLNTIRRQHEKITLLIAASALTDKTQGFLNADLTGDRSMLTAETREIFSITGLSHILALSGLHVGIIALIISLVLLPLRLTGLNNLRTILTIILLWMFAIMTGLSPSVVRAVIMASVLLISAMLQRVRAPFNSLCLAALLILLFTPQAIYSIGFQLSFLAVISILLFAEKINPFSRRNAIAYTFATYPAVTLAALLGTGIVSAYYFNILPVYALPVNFISALLLPLILGGGIVLLSANAAGLQWLWLADCVDSLYSIILSASTFASTLPGAVADGILLHPFTIAAWFVTLAAFAIWLYRRRPAGLAATIMLSVFTVFITASFRCNADPGAELYIPRTGRHTSVIIRHDNTLVFATTARNHETGDIIDSYTQKYRLFMLKRGIDSIRPLPAHCHSGLFSRHDNLLTFRTHSGRLTESSADSLLTILMVYDKSHVSDCDRHISYALVCNGFRGDIRDLAAEIRPDTILLSADLNRRRHDRYRQELTEADIPHRSLRNTPFSIILKPIH